MLIVAPVALPPGRLKLATTAEQSNELAPLHHSITSSARARSVGGTVSPSAMAVLRLSIHPNRKRWYAICMESVTKVARGRALFRCLF